MFNIHRSLALIKGQLSKSQYFKNVANVEYSKALRHEFLDNANSPNTTHARNAMWNYLSAATRGHKDAQYKIGISYLNGQLGCNQNAHQAIKWLTKAAEQGHNEAKFKLLSLLSTLAL